MKKSLIALLFLFPAWIYAQDKPFTVQGSIGKHNSPATIHLAYTLKGQRINDSCVLKNGAFQMKGTLNDTVMASLWLDYTGKTPQRKISDFITFYLEPVKTKVMAKDSLKNAAFTGSQVTTEYLYYSKVVLAPVVAKRKEMQDFYQAASPETRRTKEFNDSYEKMYDAMDELNRKIATTYLQDHQNSFISLTALRTVGGYTPDPKLVEPIFNSLSEKVRKSTAGKEYSDNLVKWKRVAIGATAPDFTQNDPNGNPVKLSGFRGKYLLVDFWASWCGPCRQENPNVVKTYAKYKDKNFTILSVSLDRENARDAWMKAIKDDNLTWNHVSDLKYWKNEAAVLYAVQAIPDNFLINPDGVIIARGLRGDDLDKKLGEIFQ